MTRHYGSTRSGGGFSETAKQLVWAKGQSVLGYNDAQYRKDVCGAWMQWEKYGDTNSDMGWEIDHDFPVVRGGTDDISNLQPLQWQNNRHKSDNWPSWTCQIKAS